MSVGIVGGNMSSTGESYVQHMVKSVIGAQNQITSPGSVAVLRPKPSQRQVQAVDEDANEAFPTEALFVNLDDTQMVTPKLESGN